MESRAGWHEQPSMNARSPPDPNTPESQALRNVTYDISVLGGKIEEDKK